MTLLEVMVVLGIIVILAGIVIPVLVFARKDAQSLKCKSNLQQLGQLFNNYAQQNHGALVPWGTPDQFHSLTMWPETLKKSEQPGVFICPTAEEYEDLSYAMNWHVMISMPRLGDRNEDWLPSPEVAFLVENWPGGNQDFAGPIPLWAPKPMTCFERHARKTKCNILWLDFHVSDEKPKWWKSHRNPIHPFKLPPDDLGGPSMY